MLLVEDMLGNESYCILTGITTAYHTKISFSGRLVDKTIVINWQYNDRYGVCPAYTLKVRMLLKQNNKIMV